MRFTALAAMADGDIVSPARAATARSRMGQRPEQTLLIDRFMRLRVVSQAQGLPKSALLLAWVNLPRFSINESHSCCTTSVLRPACGGHDGLAHEPGP